MDDNVFEINGVSRSFGTVKAVENLTLSLGKGEVTGFLGTNGAGKTTTIKMLIGLIRPTSGTVRLFGGDPSDAASRARIGYMPEMAYYYPYLNVRELLSFYGGVCGMDKKMVKSRTDELLEEVELADVAKRPLKEYSKGMLQRAGIAQALLHDPELLVLDEPFTGLDPLARADFRDILKELRDADKTIFFSSHELSEAETVCDHVAIVKEGKVVLQGATHDIVGDGRGNLERLFLEVLGGKPHL